MSSLGVVGAAGGSKAAVRGVGVDEGGGHVGAHLRSLSAARKRYSEVGALWRAPEPASSRGCRLRRAAPHARARAQPRADGGAPRFVAGAANSGCCCAVGAAGAARSARAAGGGRGWRRGIQSLGGRVPLRLYGGVARCTLHHHRPPLSSLIPEIVDAAPEFSRLFKAECNGGGMQRSFCFQKPRHSGRRACNAVRTTPP